MKKNTFRVNMVNNSSVAMPRKWILGVLNHLLHNLNLQNELTVVFLNVHQARKINFEYRKKNYATDILSFSGQGFELGELILCPQVLKKQAEEQGHTFKKELAYMLIHGVLHLLGYEHEGTSAQAKRKAKKMFKLQEQLFDSFVKSYES